MKKLFLGALASIVLLGFSGGAWADSVVEVWNCKLIAGKTIADAQAVNKRWVAWMRANVHEEITSSALTPIVADLGGVMYADTYPDIATWAAGEEKQMSAEGKAIEDSFGEILLCSDSQLWALHTTE